MITTTQQTFDFDLVQKELFFPSLMSADRCRYCHRPIKGRHSLCAGGACAQGFWVQCDVCCAERAAARLPDMVGVEIERAA